MMYKLSLLAVSVLVAGSQAYWVDPVSCKNPPVDTDKVVAAIDEAFNMAGNAYFGLDDVIKNAADKKANIEDLAGWLFGPNDNGKWTTAQNYLGIGGNPLFKKVDVKDGIRVYCDVERLKVGKNDEGKVITTDKENNYAMYEDSKTICDQSVGTKAWTSRSSAGFSVISICPWYLAFNKAAKYTGWKGLLLNAGNKLDKGLSVFEGLAPIDQVSMLTQTLLHELTHTAAAGAAEDVAGKTNSYMWKNCRTLSTQANSVNNAESLGFFGIGVQLIGDGFTITEDGKFSKPGGSKRSIDELIEKVWVA